MSVAETRLSVGLERVVELSEFVESLIGLGGWKKSVIWGWGFVGRVLASCAHVKSGLSLCHRKSWAQGHMLAIPAPGSWAQEIKIIFSCIATLGRSACAT